MSGLKKLIPLLDRVLVQKAVAPTKSVGGILLPESATSKVNKGTVLAVGQGRRTNNGELIAPAVKVGDVVLLPEYGGTTVKLEEEELLLYRDEELLGILQE
ncbi:hypothetical protein H632_c37p4 [Helicosporidium sp. ATCC 50920]|nr:hypothetical protein H632_c37p4 [Helicosporidium sp. ATCC 50920]|eukprot:KDD77028.1 hypothetical protein H632_c37p4 [Helicosporidium sp. ATCC 50920]